MTELLPPGDLRVELKSNDPLHGISFRLDRILWQAKSTEAVPQSNLLKFIYIRALPNGGPEVTAASSVAMLHIGPFATSCTGVLVDPKTVATNYHCIEKSFSFRATEQANKPSCADVLIEFDYLAPDQRGSTSSCIGVRAKKELDVALLTFDPDAIQIAPGKARVPVKIRPATEGPATLMRLIHHPLGLPLVLEDSCSVKGVEQEDFLHDCNSTPGSSGSPLFDDQMRWTGLHYKGPFPNTWTLQEWYDDFIKNGPRYNRAKLSQAVSQFLNE
jgi:hypothetical protein